jgi:hypothetical protein
MLDYILLVASFIFACVVIGKLDSIIQIIAFCIKYYKGLGLASAKYNKYNVRSGTKIHRLFLLRDLISEKIDNTVGYEKCSNCNIKTWQTEHPWLWLELADGSYVSECSCCKHLMRWIDGPGIMLPIDISEAAKNEFLEKKDSFIQENKINQVHPVI